MGDPTQGWSRSRPSARSGAPRNVAKPEGDLVLEPGANSGPGVRESRARLGQRALAAAAPETRLDARALLTGRASKAIGRQMVRHGMTLVAAPESFPVGPKSHLLAGEADRARAWGRALAMAVRD